MIKVLVDFEPTSEQNLNRVLLSIGPALDVKSKEALDQAASAVFNQLRTGFLAEHDPWGNPWVPSIAGLRRKAKGTGQTLFDTGDLFRSLQLYVDNDYQRRIGTDVDYAPYLQLGQGRGNIPRVFVELTEAHVELIASIFQQKVQEALNEQNP